MSTERNEHLIGGRWVTADSAPQPVENPATLETIGTTAMGNAAHVDAAVTSAREAFLDWSRTTPEVRRAALLDLAAQVRARRDALVEVLVAELGAPRHVAADVHVAATVGDLEAFAAVLEDLAFTSEVGNSLVVHEPLGVIACITPWNYPTHQIAAKIGAAIAAGCTVVLKPSEVTPLCAYLLGDALVASAVPDGVVNIVFGDGAGVGEALTTSRGIDAISFTGSTRIGVHIATLAAARLLPVSLELGGKSASVVLDDADLERAVAWTVRSATVNSGQTCSACTRLIVPAYLADAAAGLARAQMGALRVGDPTTDVDLGPLASRAQFEKVGAMVSQAAADGATVHQSSVNTDLPGWFMAPTLVTDADPDSSIVQDEVFGPVLTIQAATDVDHAVELANHSPYGLGGAVWSADVERATAVARRLHTGQVDINGADWNLQAPFGGVKQSGTGRELGAHGVLEFTSLKAVQR